MSVRAFAEMVETSDENKIPVNSSQLMMVRNERNFSLPRKIDLTVHLQGDVYPVIDISDTGVAFSVGISTAIQKGTLYDIILRARNTQIDLFKCQGQVIWIGQKDDKNAVGLAFVSHFLPLQFLEALESLSLHHSVFGESYAQFEQIPADFKHLVYDAREYLRGLKMYLDEIDRKIAGSSSEVMESYLRAIDLTVGPEITSVLTTFNSRLNDYLGLLRDKGLKGRVLKFFREELNEFYLQSSYARRALEKPRGYAGDYEMMNQVYRNEYEGASLFAKVLHKYTVNEAAAKSVRFRRNYLRQKIVDYSANRDCFVVASLASGPAREVIDFLMQVSREDSQKYTFVLIDQDMEALVRSKREILEVTLKRQLNVQLHFLPISVKDIIENQDVFAYSLKGLRFDFLYTAGLYDYLTQPVARFLTRQLMRCVSEQGHLIVGNFHPDNTTRAISEFAVDWHLIHRSEQEMLDLVEGLVVKETRLYFDDERIDLFLEIDK